MKVYARDKQHILDGHNGLRNRFAKENRASNMNVLHWDNDLQEMAEGWIRRCSIDVDICNYICGCFQYFNIAYFILTPRSCLYFSFQKVNDSFSVGQNIHYTNTMSPKRGWATGAIREWYLHGNTINVSFWDKYVNGHLNDLNINITFFTQLMWAKTEFVGCGVAEYILFFQ